MDPRFCYAILFEVNLMALTPLRIVQDAIIGSLCPDQSLRTVLVNSKLWLGLLVQLDRPEFSEDLKTIKWLDGQTIVKKHMERVRNSTNYDEMDPFIIKCNDYIDGVRVVLGPKIV